MNGVEGVGKTTIGAYAPKPAILMAGSETGYRTLFNYDRAPKCPCMQLESWTDTLTTLQDLEGEAGAPFETIVLDAFGGFERQCHWHVCQGKYGGDWGEKGFEAYQRGYKESVGEWEKLLASCNRIRTRHNAMILLLSHTTVRLFNNPNGSDFSRYEPDVDRRTWSRTHRWSDAVFFLTFHTYTEEDKGKHKGKGGTERILYTERRDPWDAKNRFGMKPDIDMPNDPKLMWSTIETAIKGTRNARG